MKSEKSAELRAQNQRFDLGNMERSVYASQGGGLEESNSAEASESAWGW